MKTVGLIADDLTGALDAAAAFASQRHPFPVTSLQDIQSQTKRFATNLETRDLLTGAAEERVKEILPRLGSCQIAFKKIDTLMRGNTFAELRTCCESKLFRTIVVAPAFPEQGRITKGGRQFSKNVEGNWISTGASIADMLAGGHMPTRVVTRCGELKGGGIIICDAEFSRDLKHAVSAWPQLHDPVLWCGSAGLAKELSNNRQPPLRPTGRRRLAIVGSRHPSTLAQIDYYSRNSRNAIGIIRVGSDITKVIRDLRYYLDREVSVLVQIGSNFEDAKFAFDLHHHFFECLKELAPPDLVVVCGGDTLYRLVQTMNATVLSATGEWSPGVAVSLILDGQWRGTSVVSKSGSFGSPNCLMSILDFAEGRL